MKRFSSRRKNLGQSFLSDRLKDAIAYDRIAGYFTSSIFEVAGEALESVKGRIRVVCNSEVDARDLETARSAALSLKYQWSSSCPELKMIKGPERFMRLYDFLRSGKMEVRVLPSDAFGLIHGKAGVITPASGKKTSFLGSVNESVMAWTLNYELVWEDESDDAITWVQTEFDALWNDPRARPLSEFVISDINRIRNRVVIEHLKDWKKSADPAATAIESPVYRESIGLAEHQKYFVRLAFELHKSSYGTRLILADSVGLGKTIQLAMSAQLMALYGQKPVLVLVPKTLVGQWQNELKTLLAIPSAVWDGKKWIDENRNETIPVGPQGILNCPRKIGIVSHGIITSGSEACEYLKKVSYECIIIDEAHRARRRNLGPDCASDKAQPNNLLKFANEVSVQTHSMLLATATPVQLYPIEVWDLLNSLAQGSDHVFGNRSSLWRRDPERALRLIMGYEDLSTSSESDKWEIMRNPFPLSIEDQKEFSSIRLSFKNSEQAVIPGDEWQNMRVSVRGKLQKLAKNFTEKYNPFIRNIVKRTRDYLEQQIDPESKEPLLSPIAVRLFGEEIPIPLPGYLKDAYGYAEEFCRLLGRRTKSAGFLKTILLRRVGSSIEAGQNTARRILQHQETDLLQEDDEGYEEDITVGIFDDMTSEEIGCLRNFIDALEVNKHEDPKVEVVLKCLKEGIEETEPWLNLGCIIFSQYYDSVKWLAGQVTKAFPDEKIGIYAGGGKSGILHNGDFKKFSRDLIKKMVFAHEIRLIIGTDAASEGLNLQTLGTLINLDLPWNPTRLEQRKGRIQRIGQIRDTVYLYNMRYEDSVEDRVHHLLSERFRSINALFGQIPDVLEDVWVDVALGEREAAKKKITSIPDKHPFELKYSEVKSVDWESCTEVLDDDVKKSKLRESW